MNVAVNAFKLEADAEADGFLFRVRSVVLETEPQTVMQRIFADLVHEFDAGRELEMLQLDAKYALEQERTALQKTSLFLYEFLSSGERFVRFSGLTDVSVAAAVAGCGADLVRVDADEWREMLGSLVPASYVHARVELFSDLESYHALSAEGVSAAVAPDTETRMNSLMRNTLLEPYHDKDVDDWSELLEAAERLDGTVFGEANVQAARTLAGRKFSHGGESLQELRQLVLNA